MCSYYTNEASSDVLLLATTVVAAISYLALALLVLHVATPGNPPTPDEAFPSTLPAISSLTAMIASFSLCVSAVGDGDKKSLDKSLAQLNALVTGKQMRKLIHASKYVQKAR